MTGVQERDVVQDHIWVSEPGAGRQIVHREPGLHGTVHTLCVPPPWTPPSGGRCPRNAALRLSLLRQASRGSPKKGGALCPP